MKYGCFGLMTRKLLTKDEQHFLHRFSKEFERAYTRFLDLKKAEEQAREAQVEAALERVRSRSIAMRSSEELADISFELVKQVLALGIDNWFCAFNIYDDHPDGSLEWGSNAQGTYEAYRTPREGIFQKYYEAGQNGESLLINEINEKECSAHYDYLCSLPGVGQQLLAMKEAGIPFPKSQIDHVAFFKYGYVLFITFEHIPAAHHIFTRFAKVFEQSYTRFIDLKKAEEQAHEVQIELSLERIRAQVTVMQESSDLFDIVVDMRKEFLKLGHEADYFWYMHYSPDSYEMSMTSEDGSRIGMVINIPKYVHQNIPGLFEWENSDEPTYVLALDAEGAWDYIDNMNKHGQYKQVDPNAPTEEDIRHIGGLTFILARTTHGEIGFSISGFVEDPPQDALDTLARFAGVFDLAYRRFEDLKSAERQNRETQIELSLERIRSKVTAMQESVELLEIVVSMRHEFVALGHEAHYFWFMNYLPETYEKAMTSGDGSQIGMVMTLPRHIHGDINLIADWEKSQEPTVVYAMETEEAVDYVQKMITLGDFKQVDPQAPTLDDIRHIQGLTFIMARTTHGEIGFSLPGCVPEPPQESLDTLIRFAAVFDLAYRRFEDLKSAEKQNRETQIELSLERVRASAMAMQKPEDLSAIARTIFTEFKSLDFESMRNTEVVINNYENETVITYHYSDYGGIEVIEVNYKENPIVKKWAEDLKKAEDAFVPVSIPESDIKSWDQYRLELGYQSDPKMADAKGVHYYSYSTGVGALSVSTWHVLSEEQIKILARFRNVFNLAYKRYADISFAKAQAREAVKRASLDRVRGQIASMRSTKDLEQITPLIWNELQTLDVPFFRCGVLIVDEEKQEVNFYLSNPQGEALAVIDLPFYSSKLTKNVVSSWKKKKVFTDHWDKDAFLKWSKSMLGKSNKTNSSSHKESEEAPESLDLHFIPFAQGMLYVGNSEPLSAENLELVESLALTFAFGFSRYQDFIEMEKAKKSLEKTLNDLKATQTQLIHAEKMASLGELTAGIAHEIQNPLNFVNNFSEVSTDLIEELNEELKNGDMEEVMAIAEDLLQNLEKITNHGKRASSIVKGMLEHSRSGSGEKTLTDINLLADEYLRLAYHGLRAKNKSFNADFKMIADEELPHLNIVPQEIGRVLLNLINNAFYAVEEKTKQNHKDYKPQVVVSTAQLGNGVEIRVKDNGNGIPDKVKEKIFQPFFTTKPTGQGTGLGLSMSYDIITKGHNGELKVETTPGKGTEFIIVLPKKYKR
jgi:signal transduction histidine kinase